MKTRYVIITLSIILFCSAGIMIWATDKTDKTEREKRQLVDTRIDNNKYWIKMASEGLATLNPQVEVEKAVYKGSKIEAYSVRTLNSPDVPVTTDASTQSENSIFINPNDPDNVLNSNNSTNSSVSTLYGANDLYSFDGAETWDGEIYGAGGGNSGDPTTGIGNNGRWYVGFITNSYGQGVSYSDDQGQNWTSKTVANTGGASVLDKNHMWIDNSTDSPYDGRLYNAWTPLGGSNPNNDEIELCYSSDDGETWSTRQSISDAVNAGSHNQGVNLQTGPEGEVYAVWAIYDNWPQDEPALGFARSYDGGETWDPAFRIIENIRGIRSSETSKNQRVNSFPSMTVDKSPGPNRGNIYVVWTNIGVPGVNTGNDIDVYMIRSTDEGDTWSEPIRVNQDPTGLGHEHYFPWITCDPVTGVLSAVFYDDRNVGGNQCEVFCANSIDGGDTWEDFQVSDVAFTPAPIPGLAGGYFGDYLGITANNGKVYPCWTDNRDSYAMTYVSPYVVNVLVAPENLIADLTFETGDVVLDWTFEGADEFDYFKVYRDQVLLGTTTELTYYDVLPDYGLYEYAVSAFYTSELESIPAKAGLQWGDAHIEVDPMEITDNLKPGESSTHYVTIYSVGELELDYTISRFIPSSDREVLAYCAASGGCDEFISNVQVGDIDNSSVCEGYQDFTDLSTTMSTGIGYDITVENGNAYQGDQCGIWIDWNQNDTLHINEMIDLEGTPGLGPYTGTIVPPDNAVGGETRMRIRITYTGDLISCGTTTYGEVEDYSIFVLNWLNISGTGGSVPAGDSTVIMVTLDAEYLDVGNYYAELIITNNDPDQPEIIVPINLMVNDLEVEASIDPGSICSGESVELTANVTGGMGEYNFSWTSIPEGFTSTEQNPVFDDVTEDTEFMVEVTDDLGSVYANASVMVHALPTVDLGNDTTLCAHTSIMLDAGVQPNSTYLWSNGETTQIITVDSSGVGIGTEEISVTVTNEYDCESTSSVEITFKDCTGIEEIEEQISLDIYPNPSDGQFYIALNSENPDVLSLKVFNPVGAIVYQKNNIRIHGEYKENIKLNGVSNGIYTVFIIKGSKTISKKIIIN